MRASTLSMVGAFEAAARTRAVTAGAAGAACASITGARSVAAATVAGAVIGAVPTTTAAQSIMILRVLMIFSSAVYGHNMLVGGPSDCIRRSYATPLLKRRLLDQSAIGQRVARTRVGGRAM